MNEETKLILGLQQIDNLVSLIQGNECEEYLHRQLIKVKIHLHRQLTNLTHSSTIEK